jgi:hypothetical protein
MAVQTFNSRVITIVFVIIEITFFFVGVSVRLTVLIKNNVNPFDAYRRTGRGFAIKIKH